MDKNTSVALGEQLMRELDILAAKYNIFSFRFIGIAGEPGKGSFPICVSDTPKKELCNHPHALLCKAAFIRGVETIKSLSGNDTFFERVDKKIRKDTRGQN